MAPAPPPPPGGPQGMPGAFKIVPGLGDALHEAMKKISGVEEIAPAAEGLTIFIIVLLFWDLNGKSITSTYCNVHQFT